MKLGECRLSLLGTVAGYVPDGPRVEQAIAELAPDALALGVPEEDLATLDHLAEHGMMELVAPDPVTAAFLEGLRAYGETRVPSPDLEAAHREAKARGIPVVAVDLPDDAHAAVFTREVGFFHVLRSNARTKRVLRRGVGAGKPGGPADAYAFAAAWDHELAATSAFHAVESQREQWMASRIRQVCARPGKARVLAIVPAARLDGVVRLLATEGLA